MKDTISEIQATRRAAGLYDFSEHGKIAVTGTDRIAFLQAMLASDVARLPAGSAQPSLLVTAKGKLVSDLLVIRREEEVLIETPAERRAVAAETLGRFVIAEDVEIADASRDWALLSLHGPLAGHVLSHACVGFDPIPAREFLSSEIDQPEGRVLVIRNDRLGLPGFDIWATAAAGNLLRDRILECGEAHGVRACGARAREALRIAAGRPAWGREIDDDRFPGEVGLSGAISYEKGCYVGQEVLARIRFQGHVNRLLARVEMEEAPGAPLPLPLFREGGEAGRLTSAAHLPDDELAVGLAVVRAEGAAPAAAYEARPPGGSPFLVTVRALIP